MLTGAKAKEPSAKSFIKETQDFGYQAQGEAGLLTRRAAKVRNRRKGGLKLGMARHGPDKTRFFQGGAGYRNEDCTVKNRICGYKVAARFT